MSRKPRFVIPGAPQHVIQHGYNSVPCFYEPDDYSRYLDELNHALKAKKLVSDSSFRCGYGP